jgi:hypothetical protein
MNLDFAREMEGQFFVELLGNPTSANESAKTSDEPQEHQSGLGLKCDIVTPR